MAQRYSRMLPPEIVVMILLTTLLPPLPVVCTNRKHVNFLLNTDKHKAQADSCEK